LDDGNAPIIEYSVIIEEFIKDNPNCETCLIWGCYRFGIRARLRFSLWDIDYGVKTLRNWLVRTEDYYDILGDLWHW